MGVKKDGQKKDKDGHEGDDRNDDKFPEVFDCFMIYGGPSTQHTP